MNAFSRHGLDPALSVQVSSTGHAILDQPSGQLSCGRSKVKLTRAEQAILSRLMRAQGAVVTREQLYDALYSGRAECDWPEPKIIDVFVCKLRRKLSQLGQCAGIETVWGRGWRIVGAAPRLALGLTSAEWRCLEVIVSLAERLNPIAAECVRTALHRADA